MFIVYVLFLEKFNKIYVGMTSNLEQRFRSHNELSKKGWTKNFRPWKIIYQENYTQKEEALKREKQLKSAAGRSFIWESIKKINQYRGIVYAGMNKNPRIILLSFLQSSRSMQAERAKLITG